VRLSTTINSQSGKSNVVVIVLISIGLAIVLGLLGIYLFAPNATHARMLANEYAAIAEVRTLSMHEAMSSSMFGDAGFAPTLAALGPGPDGKCSGGPSATHGCMIDAVLGASTCTGTSWCGQDAYKFNIQGICANGKCSDFVISATPVDALNGSRNFCASSDDVVRSETYAPKSAPFTLAACKALPAM
jgi:hypothetical protein